MKWRYIYIRVYIYSLIYIPKIHRFHIFSCIWFLLSKWALDPTCLADVLSDIDPFPVGQPAHCRRSCCRGQRRVYGVDVIAQVDGLLDTDGLSFAFYMSRTNVANREILMVGFVITVFIWFALQAKATLKRFIMGYPYLTTGRHTPWPQEYQSCNG